MVELTILGISLQGEGGAPVLLLHPHGQERILSLSIGPMEAFAISSVLNAPHQEQSGDVYFKEQAVSLSPDGSSSLVDSAKKIFLSAGDKARAIFPRPQTHDLTLQFITTLGGKLLGVEILRVTDGIFFAEAVLSTGSTIVRVDCRPSDGVALALRCGARLRATESVLAYAEDAADVLELLPEHVRLLARSRMAVQNSLQAAREERRGTSASGDGKISLELDAALGLSALLQGKSARETRGAQSAETVTEEKNPEETKRPGRISIKEVSFSLDDLDEDRVVPQQRKAGETELPGFAPDSQEEKLSGIRISLVRQNADGTLEFLENASLNGQKASAEDMAAAKTELLDEDERWASLLKVLKPETKTLM